MCRHDPRRQLLGRAAVLLLLGGGALSSAAQERDWGAIEIQTVAVAAGVHMLVGAGGNIGVSSGPDGVILVDDQFAPLSEKVLAAVAALGSGPVRFVLNTHWHGDHTGGNENLGKAGALIVAHDNVRVRMSSEQINRLFGDRTPPSPAGALPVVTFGDDVTFHWNGQTIHALHVSSAHTDGDAIVHFREPDVMHMGDVFFHGRYPFVDRDTGGSVDGLITAVERILAMAGPGTKIIPGHGELTDRRGLEDYHRMLTTIRARVAELAAAGKSREEALAAKPTAEFDERWGGGFITPDHMVGFVYDELAQKGNR